MTKNIDIVYFDAASGHRSAAIALKHAIASKYPSYVIRTINLVDIFDHHPVFGKIARAGIKYFNWQLKKDKVFDLNGLINLSLLSHDLVFKKGQIKIANFWKNTTPDIVISVAPMYNPVLYKSVRILNPNTICITIPVDFEEAKSRYWFTPAVEQYYLNGTEKLHTQATTVGVPEQYAYRISGMVIDPAAYFNKTIDKRTALEALELDPDKPTGFLSFGGQGCIRVKEITKAISELNLPINMIIMCGKNEQLYKAVNNLQTRFPKKVFKYLQETPLYYLRLADVAIGKPGAMTITEALITQTPLITLKSKGMHLVQKGNEDWITETKTGIVAKNVKEVAASIYTILTNPVFKENILKQQHNAIEEAVTIIHDIATNQPKLTIFYEAASNTTTTSNWHKNVPI